jgi:hypothetical protein
VRGCLSEKAGKKNFLQRDEAELVFVLSDKNGRIFFWTNFFCVTLSDPTPSQLL